MNMDSDIFFVNNTPNDLTWAEAVHYTVQRVLAVRAVSPLLVAGHQFSGCQQSLPRLPSPWPPPCLSLVPGDNGDLWLAGTGHHTSVSDLTTIVCFSSSLATILSSSPQHYHLFIWSQSTYIIDRNHWGYHINTLCKNPGQWTIKKLTPLIL